MRKDVGRYSHWRRHYKKSRFRKVVARDLYSKIIYYPLAFEWVL